MYSLGSWDNSLSLSLPLLSDTQQHADQIAQAVTVSYESLGKPILTIEDAIEQKSFFSSPGKSVKKVGDPQGVYYIPKVEVHVLKLNN